VAELKSINDTIHGTIRLDELTLDLMETLELQRLNSIRQLGLTYLVFPGANHSRIEHALGVSHVAGQMADAIGLGAEERKVSVAAGLLHDVGHGPFSHTLEHALSSQLRLDHMHLTQQIILGEDDNVRPEERKAFPDVPRVPEVLEKHGLKPRVIADLIRSVPAPAGLVGLTKPGDRYLGQIIHSAVDADQIDYLMRDSHYTGVAHGMIDARRLLQTMLLHNGEVVIDRKGLPALEGMLVARALMYSSVYFHKTVRIAEQMLSRAVERSEAPMSDVQKMVDHELLSWLSEQGGFQRETALRIKYRRLFKRAWERSKRQVSEDERKSLAKLSDPEVRRRAEDVIARKVGAPQGHVIVDVPLPELLISEPRITKTDVKVFDEGKVSYLSRVSPLGRALQVREVSDWVVMVSADPVYRKKVSSVAEKVLL